MFQKYQVLQKVFKPICKSIAFFFFGSTSVSNISLDREGEREGEGERFK